MLATRDVARIATPFLAALAILAGAQCVDRDETAAGPATSQQAVEDGPDAIVASDAAEQGSGGAICVTQDGVPYESDAC